MLQRMREHTQGLAAKILLGLIIFVLSIFGFGAFEAFVSQNPPAATVNGDEISQSTLAVETERQRQRLIDELGEGATPDSIDATLLQRRVLDGLINRALLLQTADDMGLGVSEQQIDRLIVETPQFQTDGKFDAELFKRLIANNGHNPVSYRKELASSVLLMQLNGSITETGVVTALERRQLAALLSQRRDVAVASFEPSALARDITVDDVRVQDYYESHPDEFVTEETVDVDYVEVTVASLANDPAVVVTDEDTLALYEAEKKAFVPQERRRASHILLETGDKRSAEEAEATLAAVKARVLGGESFATIAKEISEDPGSAEQGGDLGFNGKQVFVPAFEDALWALAPGALSEPIRTEFGVHLIQLNEVRNDTYPELAAVKDELSKRLVRQRAEELFAERVRRLDQLAFESPESLDTVAQELGTEVAHVDGLTRQNGTGLFAEATFRNAVFTPDVLERSFNSPAIERDGVAISARVRTRHESAQRPFDEVADAVRSKLADQDARELARTKADDMQGRLLAGESVSAVAQAAGVEWQVVANARRQMPNVSGPALRTAFELPRPAADGRSVGIAELPGGGTAVVVVTRVVDGEYTMLTEAERRSLDEQLVRRAGNLDLTAVFETARDASSIKRI